MAKVFNYLFILVVLLNISFTFSQNIISVNYNIARDYNSFEECGLNGEPVCTSLEDAGNRAIILSKTSNPTNYINIIGDINGSTPVSLGNLYNYCGKLYIRSSNTSVNINIDGSNSTQQPFLNIQEADQPNSTYPCSVQRLFQFQYLNFKNWDQTIVNININQETDQVSINPSKSLLIYFQIVNIISSSSILMIYPKNLGQTYNEKAIKVAFVTTIATNLRSSSVLFSPNSTEDHLSPIYIVGASIIRILNLSNSSLLSTPFIFLKNATLSTGAADSYASNNNFSSNPFIMSTEGGNIVIISLSFINNRLSTFLYFSNSFNQPSIGVAFSNNTFSSDINQKCKYINYKYENSVIVVKESIFSTLDLLDYYSLAQNIITNNLIFVGDSNLNLDNSIISSSFYGEKHIINTIDSSISINNLNLTWSDLPIIGSNSNIYLYYSVFTNDVFCGCQGCNFYNQSIFVDPTVYSSECNL